MTAYLFGGIIGEYWFHHWICYLCSLYELLTWEKQKQNREYPAGIWPSWTLSNFSYFVHSLPSINAALLFHNQVSSVSHLDSFPFTLVYSSLTLIWYWIKALRSSAKDKMTTHIRFSYPFLPNQACTFTIFYCLFTVVYYFIHLLVDVSLEGKSREGTWIIFWDIWKV